MSLYVLVRVMAAMFLIGIVVCASAEAATKHRHAKTGAHPDRVINLNRSD
jgi:hypothetical protein